MPFQLRKISSKPDPLSSALDNFLKKAIRPEDSPITQPDQSGQYQESTEFDYLKSAILNNPYLNEIFKNLSYIGIDVDEFIANLTYNLIENTVKLDENQIKINNLIEVLKNKKPVNWSDLSLREKNQILESHGFDDHVAPMKVRRTNEFYPLTSKEIKLMNEISKDFFEKENGKSVGLKSRLDKNYIISLLEKLKSEILNQIEIKKETVLRPENLQYSQIEWLDEEVKIQEVEKINKKFDAITEDFLKDFDSRKMANVIEDILETAGSDIVGADYSIMETIAPFFDKTVFFDKSDLENFIESLEILINPEKNIRTEDPDKNKLMHPENLRTLRVGEKYKFNNKIHTILEIFLDEKENLEKVKTDLGIYHYDNFSRNSRKVQEESDQKFSPFPGQETRYQTELKMQENWDVLLGDFGKEQNLKNIESFLENYDISSSEVLGMSLPSFDSNNPKPNETNIQEYQNWKKRKFIAFIQTSKVYSENIGTALKSSTDFFSKNIGDAMIGIASGIRMTNENGLKNINLSIEDPFKQFEKLDKIINAFKGNINDLYKRFKFNPDQDYTNNADRIRIQKLSYIFVELNIAANELDKSISLLKNEDLDEEVIVDLKSNLPKYISSIKDNLREFVFNFNPLIKIRSNSTPQEQAEKYKSSGIYAVNPEDFSNFSKSFSSYEGSIALDMLNSLNNAAKRVVTTLDILEKRSKRKPQKELVTKLKNTLSDMKSFLKEYSGGTQEKKQLEDYLNNLKNDFNIAVGSQIADDQKQDRLQRIKEMVEKRKTSHFNIKNLFKNSQQEISDEFLNVSDRFSKSINSLSLLVENPKTLKNIIDEIEEVIFILQKELASNEPTGNVETVSKKITKIITLLKETTDEYLGINESAIGSEESEKFKKIQRSISEYYNEIIKSSIEKDTNSEAVKQIGEAIFKLCQESLPILEDLLSDFLNLDSNDRIANIAYREIQSISEDLPKLFNSYGDFKLNLAEIKAEEEYIGLNSKNTEFNEKFRKIKTESSFDPDTKVLTFYDIKSSKSSVYRENRDYEIGDPILERSLIKRKLLSLQPEGNGKFLKAIYQDTYKDPKDLSKNESGSYTVNVVYSVPQNPTVLNRILKSLEESYMSGEIKYPSDLKEKLLEISKNSTDNTVIGKQVLKFITGLINSNKDTETISRDLFDSLSISKIYKMFSSDPNTWGNPFVGSLKLDNAIEKAISTLVGNSDYGDIVPALKRIKENPKLKERLLQYAKTGNSFNTDIRKEKSKKKDTPYDRLKIYAPEVTQHIDMAMEALPEKFTYNPEFSKLVSDVINCKNNENKFKNINSLLEEAKKDTKNTIQILVRFVSDSLSDYQDRGEVDDEEENDSDYYEESSEKNYDSGPMDDEESFEGVGEDYVPSYNRRESSNKFNLKKFSSLRKR